MQTFQKHDPAFVQCYFASGGFPFEHSGPWAAPCGVAYHHRCLRAGAPFTSRFKDGRGLFLNERLRPPHYLCELCQVRSILGRELNPHWPADGALVALERVRFLDLYNSRAAGTLKKYRTALDYLNRFEEWSGTVVLKTSPLLRPPTDPSIPLQWAQLKYSVQSRQRDARGIKYNTS
jgi:hypothetical protein